MRRSWRKSLSHGLAGLAIALVLPDGGAAQTFNVIKNWQPNAFEISCGRFRTPYRGERRTDCITDFALKAYQAHVAAAAAQYLGGGFASPRRFGPLIAGWEVKGQTLRLFTDETGTGTYASVVPHSSRLSRDWCHPDGNLTMHLNPVMLDAAEKHVVGLVAAHELFHTVLLSLPEGRKTTREGGTECYRPNWISEAIPDAIAIGYTREIFPESFPPRKGQELAKNMAGLRAYNWPLFRNFRNDDHEYNTNSFWLHLADTYHGGDFKFLQSYSEVPAPTFGRGREDWLQWLDARLLADQKVKTPLHRVYPGFLTHFAGQWAGGIGEDFDRAEWLMGAFGPCETVVVSPRTPYQEIDLDIRVMAGRCISVRIAELQPDDLAAVKLGVLIPPGTHRREQRMRDVDALHLGFAFSNDQTNFNCGRLAQVMRPPPGLIGCLFEPVTGALGPAENAPNATAARLWHASSLELGPGPVQAKRVMSKDIENVYILSYAPTNPSLQRLERRGQLRVRLGVGLEWSTLSVDGSRVNSGGGDGKRAATRERAVAAMGLVALEGDMSVPASTGWIDDQGMGAIVGGGMWDMIGEARRMGSEMARELDPSGTVQRLLLFQLAEAEIVPLGGAPSEERIVVKRSFHVAPVEPLPEAATGTFRAGISGEDRENDLGYFSEHVGDATLTVEENSRGAFRARVSGDVCVVDMAAMAAAAVSGNAPDMCPRKIHVSGVISKPFAYLYRPLTELVSEETDGEKLYNRYGPPRLMRERFGGDGSGGGGNGSGSGGGGAGGAGGATTESTCGCACPRLAIPDNRNCRAQCKPQWAMCEIAAETPPEPAPKPPTPTIEAQRKWFSRLVSGSGLPPEVEQMLVDDFATMSDETRKYLIRKYRDGVQ